MTHRQFLAWQEWRWAEDWDRKQKWEWYAAREFAAEYLTKKGERIDPNKGVMPFPRELKVPPTKRQAAAAEAAKLKAAVVAALAGGKGLRHHLRHPDGSVTDAATGEVVSGPTPESARE